MSSANQIVTDIFNAALLSVDPYESGKLHADKIRQFYQDNNFKKLIIVGFGKAAPAMAKAVKDDLMDLIDTGIVVTKYGHAENTEFGVKSSELGVKKLKKIKVIEAGHPVPDENGLNATEEIIRLLKDVDEKTLVTCLISGGGSALLVSPYKGISLNEKQEITELLLKAGADINGLNTVRKHISRVKGGRLAEIAYPAKIISLILSDVIGDKLDVIASGPTSPDKTTYKDALKVLEKYKLMNKCPEKILVILQKGENGLTPETPKEGNKIFESVENIIIGSNKKALEAAKTKAESFGLQTEIISSEITGEARDVGTWLAKEAIKKKGSRGMGQGVRCLISGGETTVTVKGVGIGGRNMELALAFAMEIEGIEGITFLSAGTDGTDGPTDAAGAIVDGQTVARAKAIGFDPGTYLENNDSYNFFKQINELFITGPTGTNVMDIQIMVIG
jgi:hydroxypyruvate reductase/glycerate 2-kinase